MDKISRFKMDKMDNKMDKDSRFKVVVMTDGYASADTACVLVDLARAWADYFHTNLNGIVCEFSDEDDAEELRKVVLADKRLRGKLSNLYIGEI
jgi:hypothetical protein